CIKAFKISNPQEFPKPLLELGKGLAEKQVEVVEISDAGSVQDLSVRNKSDKFLLIYEGSLLEGEKQNRVVNATLLLEPNTETIIPVSCVERGRWNRSAQGFSKPSYDSSSKIRRNFKKNILFQKAGFKGMQSEVWEEVDKFAASEAMHNATGDYASYYQNSKKDHFVFKEGLKLPAKGIFVKAYEEDYLDYVNNEEVFTEILERITKGYEMEPKEGLAEETILPKDYFISILSSKHQDIFVQDSVGLGKDIRLETDRHYISALQVEDVFLALSIFKK
ncbi:MAG: hypothetical protein HC880_07315, partial [Bacteroidia bacterium]|nr:hypothetical protein [Bacteroidia bacterium]